MGGAIQEGFLKAVGGGRRQRGPVLYSERAGSGQEGSCGIGVGVNGKHWPGTAAVMCWALILTRPGLRSSSRGEAR